VRVIPDRDLSAALLVSGTIVKSDGNTLELHILATDARGHPWLDKVFAGNVADDYADRSPGTETPAYQEMYDEIAAELRSALAGMDEQDLELINEVSLLRYATRLAPTAFDGFLIEEPDGTVQIHRLPATNDPMLGRVALVRSTEYVITDAVDTKFRELRAEIDHVYDVWREFRRKTIQYEREDARRAADTRDEGERGSYDAIRNSYDNYKYHRVTQQEQDRLAVAFYNEAGPTIESIEARIAELEAWVDQKYTEWGRILEELFEVETGQRSDAVMPRVVTRPTRPGKQ
jgi:hypothetical protein